MLKFIPVLLFLLLSGCATRMGNTSVPVPSGANPGQYTILGEKKNGDVSVQLSCNPSSPVRGRNTLKVYLANSNGQPISDAKISFDLDMTNMSHGKNIVPATALGPGDYQGNVNFMMPGPWRVIVAIEQGGQTSSVRFDFVVKSR